MAKVDILMPYWGEFRFAKETVDSVLAQTDPDWRLVIADDCYPSNELAEYCASLVDNRITYIRHEKNLGITANFNFCVSQATAKYCVIIGCDDRLLPTYVERAISQIDDCEFYQPGVEVIDAQDAVYLPLVDRVKRILRPRKAGVYQGEKLATSLCRGNWLYFPSIMWRTETLRSHPFDPKYKIVEDVVVELNMIIDGARLMVDNMVTFQYRRFDESLSSKEKGGIRFYEESSVYNSFAESFRKIGWKKASHTARLHLLSRMHDLFSS